MTSPVSRRPVQPRDEPFLFDLFCQSHGQALFEVPLPPEHREQLLRMQFAAQQKQYRNQYPTADFDVVEQDAERVGSLVTLRGPERFVLIDIALLPAHRGGGIGTSLVSALIDEADASGKPVDAHVLKANPAWRLWQRLGFEAVDDDGLRLRIRRPPA